MLRRSKKLVAREKYLQRVYGISLDQYQDLLKKQSGKCAICGKPDKEAYKGLHVDHNHATREIRGLLCAYCNHRVVGRNRDSNLLRRVADYIDQGTGWFVPEKKRKKRRA